VIIIDLQDKLSGVYLPPGGGSDDAPLQLKIAVLELTMKPIEFEDVFLGILCFATLGAGVKRIIQKCT